MFVRASELEFEKRLDNAVEQACSIDNLKVIGLSGPTCSGKTTTAKKLLSEIEGYFGYMAKRTGTLWEKIDDRANMNHGFASYVAVWISKCLHEQNSKDIIKH